jgi:hypothetical protein
MQSTRAFFRVLEGALKVPLVVHFCGLRCAGGGAYFELVLWQNVSATRFLGSSGPILALILGVSYGGHFWLIGCAQCNRQEQIVGIGLRAMRSTRAIF